MVSSERLLMNRALFFCFRQYAEMLERRLSTFKMLCNIRLLPEELPPTKAMEELSRRRIPYAITINAQNEVHRSITLNILHGTPQGKFDEKYLILGGWTFEL